MGIIGDIIKTEAIGSEVRKGIKELKKEHERTQKSLCPKCKKGFLEKEVTIPATMFKAVFKPKKTVTFYCPSCGYENKREFDLTRRDYV